MTPTELTNLTWTELFKLNNMVELEILKRIWVIIPIFIVILWLLGRKK